MAVTYTNCMENTFTKDSEEYINNKKVPEKIKRWSVMKIASYSALVLLVIGVTFVYKRYVSAQDELVRLESIIGTLQGTPGPKTEDEKKILEKVSRLIMIPQNESPTIFTVLNADALAKEQSFFLGTVNGDILIVFRQSQKAIIYSPTRKMIVNAGPIISSLQTNQTALSADTTKIAPKTPVTKKK